MKCIKVFMPDPLPHDKEIFLKGYFDNTDTTKYKNTEIYLTEYSYIKNSLNPNLNGNHTMFGYCSNKKNIKQMLDMARNKIILYNYKQPEVIELIIDGELVKDFNIIVIFYDKNKVLNSEVLDISCDEFVVLRNFLHKEMNIPPITESYVPKVEAPTLLANSMFFQHFFNNINLFNWLRDTLKRGDRLSIKQGNFILAVILDIILGYCVMEILLFDRKEMGVLLLSVLEKLVNSMYSLLKWLMGAPAGLKLNNAFNKMLGKYFLYHVELWWLFLDVSGERLDIILHIYQYLGYFGLTFQAALISDMLCITTFHSYCIYVYAARLFNIQISGLTALLRLFVGRKFNPLRNCIDSCEYTNQELFVGTVAFTILLLLLPTTLMYYIVFTMFRIFSLFVQYILARLIYFIHTIPLYVTVLWIIRSPKLAGDVFIKERQSENSTLILDLKLFIKPLKELMKCYKPPVQMPKVVEWSNIISSVFTGKPIF